MKKIFLIALALIVLIVIISKIFGNSGQPSSITSNNTEATPAYDQFHLVFKGEPPPEEIGKLMDAIMDQYNAEHSEKEKQKIGSALYAMRKKSAIGISEMQIMKYMYQNPNTRDSLPIAIAKAAVILEYTK